MSAAPLILICGLGSDADSWRDQQAALGGTAVVAQGDSIESMAAALLADLPARIAVAGHSMGGYVALAMQRIAPDRITRLALINTNAAPDSPAQTEGRHATIAAIEKHGLERLIDPMVAAVTPEPVLRERLAAMFRRAGDARVIREQRACAARPDARPGLAAIAVPTLVIGSDDDAIMPPVASETLAAGIPGARHAQFGSGGHVTPMSHPGPVTALIRAWLEAAK